MNLLQVSVLTLFTLVFATFLQQVKPEYAVLLTAAAGVALWLGLGEQLIGVFDEIIQLLDDFTDGTVLFGVMIRAVLIAYLSEFTAQLCRDLSQGALAQKVELAGKLSIAALSLPLIRDILDLAAAFLI